MNELEQLERFRSQVEAPDAEAVEAASRRGPWHGALQRRPRRRTRRIPVGIAAAAAVIALVTALLPVGRGGPNPAAADMLRRFARIAANAPAESVPGPGQYVYRETQDTTRFLLISGDGRTRLSFLRSCVDQQWLGPDGSGRQEGTCDPAVFASDADRAAFDAYAATADGKDEFAYLANGETTHDRYGPGELPYRDTSSLPTDVDALRRLIEDRQVVDGPPGDWETFVLATDLLRDSYARPELRSALYEVMAGLDGIEVIGRTTDAIGRHGVALASEHSGYRDEVVFDPKTADILEERTVALSDDDADRVAQNAGPTIVAYARTGQTLYIATYLSFGQVADSVTQAPKG